VCECCVCVCVRVCACVCVCVCVCVHACMLDLYVILLWEYFWVFRALVPRAHNISVEAKVGIFYHSSQIIY